MKPGLVFAALLAATSALAQYVELAPSTSPSAVQGGLTDVSLTVTRGLPSGSTPASLNARITPSNGGTPIVTPITSVTAIGSRATVVFRMPAYPTSAPVDAKVELVNASGATLVTTVLPAYTVIVPAPSLDSVWQPFGYRGTSVDVVITGLYTTFPATASSVQLQFGSGVTAVAKACPTVSSATLICATVTVAANATQGPRNVSATYGATTVTLANGFYVAVPPEVPNPLHQLPASRLTQGSTTGVKFQLTGINLFTDPNVEVHIAGGGLTWSAPIVLSSIELGFNITADRRAATGFRNVWFRWTSSDGTKQQIFTGPGILEVDQAAASITSVNPNTVEQGTTLPVTITGDTTSFQQNLTRVAMGTGITVSSVQVISPTEAVAQISVTSTAALGARQVTATTGGDSPAPGVLTVTSPTPRICGVTPAGASPGDTVTVNLQVCGGTPVAGTPVTIPGAVVGTSTVSGNTLSVSVSIPKTAATGLQTGQLGSGKTTLPFNFWIYPPVGILTKACREPGCQDPAVFNSTDQFTLRVTGLNTGFSPGASTLHLVRDSDQVVVQPVKTTVTSATEILADFAWSDFPATTMTVVATTKSAQWTLGGSKVVQPAVYSLSPNQGAQGATLQVHFQWTGSQSLPAACPTISPAGGVTCYGYVSSGPWTGTALFQIDPTAAVGPRVVTAGLGMTATFTVTPGAAALTSISPGAGVVGTNVYVTLTGTQTHWCAAGCASPTVLTVTGGNGAPITVNGPLAITSPTSASVNLIIPSGTPLGATTFRMDTGGESVTLENAFLVEAAVPGVTTSDVVSQGAIKQIFLTFTGLPEALTASQSPAVSFGPGITSSGLQITGANTATTVVTVDPLYVIPSAGYALAPVTAVVNGQQLLPGSLKVVPGPAAFYTITPAFGQQGASGPVTITGLNTHFSQGLTTVSSTAGTLSNVVVSSPTSLTATLSVPTGAPAGPASVTVTTGGEVALGTNVLTIMPGTPQLIQISPGSLAQGAGPVTIAVNSAFTSWQQGVTGFNFGSGITVNNITIDSATSAHVSLTADPLATLGSRIVTATTGVQAVSSAANQFSVTAGPASISSVVGPTSVSQGDLNIQMRINGSQTHFQNGTTAVSLSGPGAPINAKSVSVVDALTANAVFDIPGNQTGGSYSINVTTGGETESKAGVVTVMTLAPEILSLTPDTAVLGSTVNVQVTGNHTNFVQGTTTVSVPGAAVNTVTVSSATALTANITVPANATTGARTVTVKTGNETANGVNMFSITAPPAVTQVSPGWIPQGAAGWQVILTGTATTWQPSLTSASFGPGITVTNLTTSSATSSIATLTADPAATVGPRTVTMTTGSELASASNLFTVTPPASLATANPSYAVVGTGPVTLTLTGQNTHWQQGLTTVVVGGGGVILTGLTIDSPTSLHVQATIAPTAPTVLRAITVSTGPEVVTNGNGFTVAGVPSLTSASPAYWSAGSGTNVVVLLGTNTHWQTGVTTASFGTGITVNSLTAVTATQLQAAITIDPAAAPGSRTVTVTTGAEVVTAANLFSVSPAPALSLIGPAQLTQGEPTRGVSFTGSFTHWQNGISTVDFGPGIVASSLVVQSPNSASAQVTVSGAATLGNHPVTITTGGESVSSYVSVVAAGITSVSPAYAHQGSGPVSVYLTGANTHWQTGSTASFGPGITVASFVVESVTSGWASITVDSNAALGSRTITVTNGQEVATGSGLLTVEPPAVITRVSPGSIVPGGTLSTVTLTGTNTHWLPGASAVSFGAGISVTPLAVDSATSLRVRLTADVAAALGNRTVTVTTTSPNGSDLETAGAANLFSVVAGPVVTQVSPASLPEGASSVTVTLTGTNTHWQQGVSQANFGPGVTSGSLTVDSPTAAHTSVSVAGNAATGPRSVTVTTGAEVANGPNTLNISTPAAVTQISPASLQQGAASVTVTITGAFTQWAQGTTTADLGAGVTVNSLTIDSATSAHAVVTVASSAPLGSRTVTITTGFEVAIGSALFSITPPASIGQVSPTSAAQGAGPVQVFITGGWTNWQQGVSTVSFGAGITVNSLTINSATSAVATITVDPTAVTGARTITVTTGGAVVLGASLFTVTASNAGISFFTPATMNQGDLGVVVTVNGNPATHFQQGVTTVALSQFPNTLNASNVSVTNASTLTATFDVPSAQTAGVYALTATTLGENASLSGMRVNTVIPSISSAAPSNGDPGTTVSVVLTGINSGWVQGTTTVSFGDLTVNSVTVANPNSLTANVTIPQLVTPGTRTITVTTSSRTLTLTNGFAVNAPVLTVSPASLVRGQTRQVVITGTKTFWAQGQTNIAGNSFAANSVTVDSPTQLTALVTMQADLPVQGTVTLQIITGPQVLTALLKVTSGITNVFPHTGTRGTTFDLTITGSETTNFVQGQSVVDLGSGITVNHVQVNSPTSLAANITVDPTAVLSTRQVFVFTGTELAAGDGTNSSEFYVNEVGKATISPTSVYQGQTGVILTFNLGIANTATAISVAGITPAPVSGDTFGSASFAIPANASLGVHAVTITAGANTYSGELLVVPPGPAIPRIAPSSASQGTQQAVVITGQNTHFITGTPVISLGSGITATLLGVDSATSLRAMLTISPSAAPGTRTVTVTTGTEVATGANLFNVIGPPALVSMNPAAAAQQQTVPVTITGQFTSFTPSSVVALGAGVTATVTAATATSIQANVTASPIAVPGPRTLSVDSLTLPNAFTVTPGPAAITTLSPAFAQVGTTLTVQVTGSLTNFQQALTTASLGSGITINGITVTSPTQASLSLTIDPAAAIGFRTFTLLTGGETASKTNGFEIRQSAPAIKLIAPASAQVGQTVSNIQVTGVNLGGAAYSIAGTQLLPATPPDTQVLLGGYVLQTTNVTSTSATLQIQFGTVPGSYVLVATTSSGASANSPTGTNQITVVTGAGYATSAAYSTPGTQSTPRDPVTNIMRYAASAAATIVGAQATPLDPPGNLMTYATSAAETMVGTRATPLDPVGNTMRYATGWAVNVKNQSSPVSVSRSDRGVGPAVKGGSSDGDAGGQELAYPGQALPVQVEIPPGVRIRGVNLYVNGRRLEDPLLAPYETILTVPGGGVEELEIRAVVLTETGEVVSPSRRIRVVHQAPGRVVPVRVADADDHEVANALVSLRYFGFLAEHYRFADPLAELPALPADPKPDTTGFAALLHYLPEGRDPLDTGAGRDTVSRYRATLLPPESANYQFLLTADNGAVLRIGGKTYSEGEFVTLEGGKPVEIEVLHYRGVAASAALHLQWRAGANRLFETLRPESLRAPSVSGAGPVPLSVSMFDVRAETGSAAGQAESVSANTTLIRISLKPTTLEKQ